MDNRLKMLIEDCEAGLIEEERQIVEASVKRGEEIEAANVERFKNWLDLDPFATIIWDIFSVDAELFSKTINQTIYQTTPRDDLRPFYLVIYGKGKASYIRELGKRNEYYWDDFQKFIYQMSQEYELWQQEREQELAIEEYTDTFVADYVQYLEDADIWRTAAYKNLKELEDSLNRKMVTGRLYYSEDSYYTVEIDDNGEAAIDALGFIYTWYSGGVKMVKMYQLKFIPLNNKDGCGYIWEVKLVENQTTKNLIASGGNWTTHGSPYIPV
jgi:hypothetical protein